MNDYISRQATIEALADWKISPIVLDPVPSANVVEADKAQKEIDYWHDRAQSYEQTILKLALNKADVVEVVRCKDCKHQRVDGNICACDLTDGYSHVCLNDDYCSRGEKKDNEQIH